MRVKVVLGWTPGRTYVDDRDMPFSMIAPTELYNDFYRRHGVGHVAGFMRRRQDNQLSILSVHRDVRLGPFTTDDIALIDSLGGHLAHGWAITRQMRRAGDLDAALTLALERFATPVFIVDGNSMIVRMSGPAEALLRTGTFLRARLGRLEAASARGSEPLRRVVAAAARDFSTAGGAGHFVKVPGLRGADHLGILAAPVPPTALGRTDLTLLFVAGANKPADVNVLRSQFDLTRAEARTAAALAEGLDVRELAARFGITTETVRGYLKSAMAKCGVNSQAQLVGVILRSLAALRIA